MVEDLRRAIEHAPQMPDGTQRQPATQIEAWLEEREWDKIVERSDVDTPRGLKPHGVSGSAQGTPSR
jgi:hypothetical protein